MKTGKGHANLEHTLSENRGVPLSFVPSAKEIEVLKVLAKLAYEIIKKDAKVSA